jgi:hypothetical protein
MSKESWAKIHHQIDDATSRILSRPNFNINISSSIYTIRTISRIIEWNQYRYVSTLYASHGYSTLKVYAIDGYEDVDHIFYTDRFDYHCMKNVRKSILILVRKIHGRPFFDILID